MAFWVAAAIAGSAILSAAGAVKSGKAQAAAVNGNAALNEKVAKAEARAVEVNGELDLRQAESEAYVVERNAQAEARFLDETIVQEHIATGRDRRDLDRERRKVLGKTKAAMAAQGHVTTEGSALEVIMDGERFYAVEDERMEQDLSVAVQSLKNRRADVVNLAAYQAGYLRESGLLANAFATVRAEDIRENAAVGSQLAASQANAIRTSSLLTAAGSLIGGAGNAYKAR